VYALKQMERIEKPRIRLVAGRLGVEKGGVTAQAQPGKKLNRRTPLA